MVQFSSALVAGLAGLAGIVSAHPGHDVRAEAAEHATLMDKIPIQSRNLNHCAERLRARGLENKSIARRDQMVRDIRQRRGLDSNAHFLRTRHHTPHHSDLDVDPSADPDILFGSNATCILAPDVTEGPYYVSGELIRTNVVDNQAGIPLFLDLQLIDTVTCEPVSEVYLDSWHCNATGVYSGVVAPGNGDSSDESNLDATFLRGVQKTDADGVVQFESIFPGHYIGRTAHIHVLTHTIGEVSANPNNTLSDLYVTHSSHVGQIYFDQDLINAAEEVAPYTSNKQPLTTNDQDFILKQAEKVIDPYVHYVFLGESIEEGIFAWISLGIAPGEDKEIDPSVWYTDDGGVENPDKGGWPGPPPS